MAQSLFPSELEGGRVLLQPFLENTQQWRFSSQLANSILVAILTTVLAYQLAEIIFDLLQGTKPPFQTTTAAIYSRLLAINPSPLAIADSVFGRDFFTRLRFRQSVREGYFPRNHTSMSTRKIAILVLLVLVAPMTNLLTIILTIEKDETMNLSSDIFGGFAFGFREGGGQVLIQRFGPCFSVPVIKSGPFTTHVDFLTCEHAYRLETVPSIGIHNSVIELTITRAATVLVHSFHPVEGFENETLKESFEFSAVLRTENDMFRVGHAITPEAARIFLNRSIHNTIWTTPHLRGFDVTIRPVEETISSGEIKLTQRIVANDDTSLDVLGFYAAMLFRDLQGNLTFVNADQILLAREESVAEGKQRIEFAEIEDIPFVRWRTKTLCEFKLAVVASVAIVLRIVIRVLTNNDVERGTERALKSFLGIPKDSQLLWNQDEVTYSNQYVLENQVLYGVERKHLRNYKN